MASKSNGAAAPGWSNRDAAEDKAQDTTSGAIDPEALPVAPDWLSRSMEGICCSGCGHPDAEFVGVYLRPGVSRRVVYRICADCLPARQRIADDVEERVHAMEALELCTTTGGAA